MEEFSASVYMEEFRKRLHFIRNSGLKKVRITVYFF